MKFNGDNFWNSALSAIVIFIVVLGFHMLVTCNQEQNIRPSTARFCKIESINPDEKCVYEREGK